MDGETEPEHGFTLLPTGSALNVMYHSLIICEEQNASAVMHGFETEKDIIRSSGMSCSQFVADLPTSVRLRCCRRTTLCL